MDGFFGPRGRGAASYVGSSGGESGSSQNEGSDLEPGECKDNECRSYLEDEEEDPAQKNVEQRLNSIREGAARGELSLDDANFYYNNSSEPIDFDASSLTVSVRQNSVKYTVLGEDWFVHGNVSLNTDGAIATENYDFEYKEGWRNIPRNYGTRRGRIRAGVTTEGNADPRGGGFRIRYFNSPKLVVDKWL
jgi:hypothetical protein